MRAESVRPLGRVVLDTNVWIRAALSRQGPTAALVRHAIENLRPVFSSVTFAELETRIWRPKLDRYLSVTLRRAILHDLGAAADWVELSPDLLSRSWSRDPDDDAFLRTALAAGAAWLVSGDADLLELGVVESLQILTPAQAMQAWCNDTPG